MTSDEVLQWLSDNHAEISLCAVGCSVGLQILTVDVKGVQHCSVFPFTNASDFIDLYLAPAVTTLKESFDDATGSNSVVVD